MTDVIQWPPVTLTAWELTEVFPQSRSVGLIQGRARTSSAQRPRRMATAGVRGIGKDHAGAGYIRMLNRLWSGGPQLTQMTCLPSIWHLAENREGFRQVPLNWTAEGDPLLWTSGGDPMIWYTGAFSIDGTPVTEGGWHGLKLTGLPASHLVARPSQQISFWGDGVHQQGFVLRVVHSDPDGSATLLTDREDAFLGSGPVSIGEPEVITFEAIEVPRAVQGLGDDFIYKWELREVFADEFADGLTVVNPWG